MTEKIVNDQIILRSSTLPFIRAGWANILFFLMFIYYSVANEFMISLSVPNQVRYATIFIGCVYILIIYKTNISRVTVDEKFISFMGSVNTESILFEEIKYVVFRERPQYFITVIKVKTTRGFLKKKYALGPVLSNILVSNQASQRVKNVLIQHGIKIISK
jgi:hypothetical protein